MTDCDHGVPPLRTGPFISATRDVLSISKTADLRIVADV